MNQKDRKVTFLAPEEKDVSTIASFLDNFDFSFTFLLFYWRILRDWFSLLSKALKYHLKKEV